MNSSAGVLIVSQEAQTARAVTELVSAHEQTTPRGTCRNLDDLVMTLDRTPVPAVVVDIDPKPAQMLSELDSIVSRYVGTRFIVLCSEQRSDLMLQAMQAGVRHYMLKSNISAELVPVLQRLMPSNGVSRNGHHGSIVTILSAGGGCGATTLAINLATELNLLQKEPTLLIDLDCCYGAAAGYMGVTAQYGIADVLADGDRIDAQLIRSTAVVHNDQVHVLASPATVDLENPAIPAYAHLGRVLQKGRETYHYTVVDAPRVPMEVAGKLGQASLMTYIVLEMHVEHIRVARAMHSSLVNSGVPQDRILPIVNRYRGRREMINMEDAQKAIGAARMGYLNNDYKAVLSSINFGKPLVTSAPRSTLRSDIQNLAKALHHAAAAKPAKARH